MNRYNCKISNCEHSKFIEVNSCKHLNKNKQIIGLILEKKKAFAKNSSF